MHLFLCVLCHYQSLVQFDIWYQIYILCIYVFHALGGELKIHVWFSKLWSYKNILFFTQHDHTDEGKERQYTIGGDKDNIKYQTQIWTDTEQRKVSTQQHPCEHTAWREGNTTQTIGRDKNNNVYNVYFTPLLPCKCNSLFDLYKKILNK